MATDKEIDELRGKIRDSLKQLLEMPVTDWATRGSLGDINFAGALPVIGRIRDLLKMLAGFNFDYISFNRLGTLHNALQAITNSFGKIRDFTLSVGNPVQQRDQIINELNGQYDSWFEAIHPIVAFAIRSTTDFEQLERELRENVSRVESSTNETLKKQEELLKEAETSVSAIKKAAAEAGVSQEAVYFKVQAEEHKSASGYWMLAMGTMAF